MTETLNEVHRIYTCRNKSHRVKHLHIDYMVTTQWDGNIAVSSEFEDLVGNSIYPNEAIYHRCTECGNVMDNVDVFAIESEESKCDLSCMHAHGPLCVCACGGYNHGRGWM